MTTPYGHAHTYNASHGYGPCQTFTSNHTIGNYYDATGVLHNGFPIINKFVPDSPRKDKPCELSVVSYLMAIGGFSFGIYSAVAGNTGGIAGGFVMGGLFSCAGCIMCAISPACLPNREAIRSLFDKACCCFCCRDAPSLEGKTKLLNSKVQEV